MNLALAIYPTLHRHGLVPRLSVETFMRIVSEWRRTDIISNGQTAVSRMPTELWLQIAEYLEPADTFALVFGAGTRFYRFKDRPSTETVWRLRTWSRISRQRS